MNTEHELFGSNERVPVITEAGWPEEADRDAPVIGDTRPCPDCGRPQHYTGTEHGWAHDALIDTWMCANPLAYGNA